MKSIIPPSILLALAMLMIGCSSSTDGLSKDSPAPTSPSRPAGANSTGMGYGGTETPGSSFYGSSPGR